MYEIARLTAGLHVHAADARRLVTILVGSHGKDRGAIRALRRHEQVVLQDGAWQPAFALRDARTTRARRRGQESVAMELNARATKPLPQDSREASREEEQGARFRDRRRRVSEPITRSLVPPVADLRDPKRLELEFGQPPA